MKLVPCLAIAMALLANGAMASDEEFVSIANEYIEHLMTVNPEWATTLGDHRFDHRLTDRSAKAIAEGASANARFLERLRKIDKSSLNETNRIDCLILENSLEWGVFQAIELKQHEWNPLDYNMTGGIYSLVAREFAPLEERLKNVARRLDGVPGVIAAARENLRNPPLVHTETAILQNKGSIGFVRDGLEEFIEKAPATREMLAGPRQRAIAALEDYGKWLEEDLLPRSDGEFRLGDEKWRKKLRFSLDSDLSKEEILRLAKKDLIETQREMYETALPLYANYVLDMTEKGERDDIKHVCKFVLDRLAEERPNNETIVDEARRILVEATEFARSNKLVTVPDEPVKLIVMPEFQRGVAIAYCDPPGPLEKNLSTFYSIAPTPEDWSAERAESFFKEYNNYMLVDLTVHEAVPGHYLQLAHSNKFEAPTLVRAIFQSGPFIEGWAVYTEKLMADAGFGGPEVKMQQLKMRLRVIINAIIDQEIHTNGMTEEAAMAMMKDEGFQEDGEAAGKWRRACLSSTQLSTYFVGSAEVEDIVAAYRRKHGAGTDTMQMHDAIISYGSPPAKYIKELMGL